MAKTPLAEFLAARRARRSPSSAGLPVDGSRRVPGLRRAEVAQLAGISVEYYTRLEQGREAGPSPAVIAGLARAFVLTPDESDHLHMLCGTVPARPGSAPEPSAGRSMSALLGAWTTTPALVVDPLHDLSAMNDLAAGLFSGFRHTGNLAEMIVLDPAAKEFFVDWPEAVTWTAGALHATRHHGDSARCRLLVDSLSADLWFAETWARHDVMPKRSGRKRLRHPYAGDIDIDIDTFGLAGAPGHLLVVCRAEPGSDDERRLLTVTRAGAPGVLPTDVGDRVVLT